MFCKAGGDNLAIGFYFVGNGAVDGGVKGFCIIVRLKGIFLSRAAATDDYGMWIESFDKRIEKVSCRAVVGHYDQVRFKVWIGREDI